MSAIAVLSQSIVNAEGFATMTARANYHGMSSLSECLDSKGLGRGNFRTCHISWQVAKPLCVHGRVDAHSNGKPCVGKDCLFARCYCGPKLLTSSLANWSVGSLVQVSSEHSTPAETFADCFGGAARTAARTATLAFTSLYQTACQSSGYHSRAFFSIPVPEPSVRVEKRGSETKEEVSKTG